MELCDPYSEAQVQDPVPEDVWIATTDYPVSGRYIPLLVERTEEMAKAALIEYVRQADLRQRQVRQSEADAHCVLMGLDPSDFPEEFSGLPFEVKCWDDLRKFYRASVYPAAFGEVCISGRRLYEGDMVRDSIEYLEHADLSDEDVMW